MCLHAVSCVSIIDRIRWTVSTKTRIKLFVREAFMVGLADEEL
jgi:hypothetical protein